MAVAPAVTVRGNFGGCGRTGKSVTKPPLEIAEYQQIFEGVGASEGIRTLDVHLGKVMLYQTELRSRYQPIDCRETLGS